MNKDSKIYVAGGTGLVGSAIIRNLLKEGYKNIISTYRRRPPFEAKGVKFYPLDLLNYEAVNTFFKEHLPNYVFLAAAKVGGIVANNTYRADFLYENLQIQNNIIHLSYKNKVDKLLFLGSSCIYPKNCPQPMKEEHLLTSTLEYTNEPYAIAKIAGLKMCESYNLQYKTNFISVMPTNLYGPEDNYHLENSHVLPALIRKMHLAKCLENSDFETIRRDFVKNSVPRFSSCYDEKNLLMLLERYGIKKENSVSIYLWGSGKPRREFLHSDDLADACIHLMNTLEFSEIEKKQEKEIKNTHINIGTGKDISIKELAELVKEIVGFKGEIKWNTEKPDGTFQKLLDVNKLKDYGWEAKINFKESLKTIYDEYKENVNF